MTYDNPHPLANPFNTRKYCNFSVGRAMARPYVRSVKNHNTLTVPNQDIPLNGSPEWYAMQNRNNLTVPNQDIPYGDMFNNFGNAGFINDRLFRLTDGTIMDYKTGRIVRNADAHDDCVVHTLGSEQYGTQYHQDEITLDDLVNHIDRYVNTAMPDGSIDTIDPKSAAYWLKAHEETEKLKVNMTDAQKQMIAAFESHFPVSRLIEESKKKIILIKINSELYADLNT